LVGGEDVFEEGGGFGGVEAAVVGVGEAGVEGFLDGDLDGGAGGLALFPVEDQQFGLQRGEEFSDDPFDQCFLGWGEGGVGFGEEVEGGEFLFGEFLSDVATAPPMATATGPAAIRPQAWRSATTGRCGQP